MKKTALVIDRDSETRDPLRRLLEGIGLEVAMSHTASEAVKFVRVAAPDVVLVNLCPGAPAIDCPHVALSRRLNEEFNLPVIAMGPVGALEALRILMRSRVYDCVPLPPRPETLLPPLRKLLELQALRIEAEGLPSGVGERRCLHGLIGRSEPMQSIFRLLPQVASNSCPILLEGESGTGKEMLARAIHLESPRRDGPFIAINCGALPEALVESELFGHERGAFTGAVSTQKGKLELAHRGTLFLDEVSEMSLLTQVKFLRALEDCGFMRVGGTKSLAMDVRVVSATNRNLRQIVQQGAFREDIFYRLNVVRLYVPPLRERREDIAPLVSHFLRELGGGLKRLAPGVMEHLKRQVWKGNVRELRNAMERAVVVSTGREIRLEDVLAPRADWIENRTQAPAFEGWLQAELLQGDSGQTRNLLEAAEEAVIRAAVNLTNGNKTRAAALLGVERKKVQRRMAKYEIVN